MKLGFEESQASYDSGSQQARVWTERWVADWMFCPNCGAARLSQFPANSPVADFFCPSCSDQFEVKAKNGKTFGNSVADGAYETKIARLTSKTNPNLLLLGYSKSAREVHSVCIVPKHFFVPDIVQKRPPLKDTARRAGWVGSNILLAKVPEAGRIFVLRNGQVEPKDAVLAKWRQTLFLQNQSIETRGWLLDVMKAVDAIGRTEFSLDDVYAFEERLKIITRITTMSALRYVRNFRCCETAGIWILSEEANIVFGVERRRRRMAWYLNHYHCDECDAEWSDDWSCTCDDDCPQCGSRHWSPYQSDDLTEIVEQEGDKFVVFSSPPSAEHHPDYEPVARFTSFELANRFIVDGELT